MGRSKSKIAVALLGALAFGAGAQTVNSGVKDAKLEQSLGAVGVATSKTNVARDEKGLLILSKVLIGAGITVGIAASIAVALLKDKYKDKYTLINLTRSEIKEDAGVPGGSEENNISEDLDNENMKENNDEALNIVLKKFQYADSKNFGRIKNFLIKSHENALNESKCQFIENLSSKEGEASKAILDFIKSGKNAKDLTITGELNTVFKIVYKNESYYCGFGTEDSQCVFLVVYNRNRILAISK